ncbi:hypothetical protein ACPPVO_37015 [Dactylosporangium sp. McL0621]|uniref:hypothetical protein n=1 Tax=Dactylosporangium sp. McL0621 TaxID=3415678 RepID=UPI003CEFE683
MTNFIEDQLAAGMREQAAGVTVDTDLVGRALRGHRRRTMVTRTAYAAGVVGLAGALAAGVLAAGANGPTSPGRPAVSGAANGAAGRGGPAVSGAGNGQAVSGAEAPRLRLAAVVAASRGTSYEVRNTISNRSQPGQPAMTISGAFDPATTTGYLYIPFGGGSAWHEERLIGGDLYITEAVAGQPVSWQHDPGTKHSALSYDVKTGVLGVSADPQQLLDTLTQSGARISQTGPDRYHFEVALAARKGLTGGDIAGDVTVGPDQRIATVVYAATLRSGADTTVLDARLELSGYGRPVTVERPGGTFETLPGK